MGDAYSWRSWAGIATTGTGGGDVSRMVLTIVGGLPEPPGAEERWRALGQLAYRRKMHQHWAGAEYSRAARVPWHQSRAARARRRSRRHGAAAGRRSGDG